VSALVDIDHTWMPATLSNWSTVIGRQLKIEVLDRGMVEVWLSIAHSECTVAIGLHNSLQILDGMVIAPISNSSYITLPTHVYITVSYPVIIVDGRLYIV